LKVNVLPGTRFHSIPLIQGLSELGFDVRVYSSSPRRNFQVLKPFSYRFIPLWNVILERLVPLSFSQYELKQNKQYDSTCRFFMRDCEVLHGWAGLSLQSGIKTKKLGGKYILERSCPHILFQEKLIKEESEKNQVLYHPKPQWWIERSLKEYEIADFIVTPSDYTRRTLLEKGLPASKVKKIPLDYKPLSKAGKNPVTSKDFISAKHFFGAKDFVVGTVMGNPLRKGLIYLLEAWDHLKLPSAKLLIKMDPSLLTSFPLIKERVQKNPSISVHGYYPNLSDFYQQCDLFILPSIDDGFGLVITEAIAHGLPTITTSHVGASENFTGQEFVKVVPPRNSEAIAQGVEHFYKNREELGYLKRDIEKYHQSQTEQQKQASYFLGIQELYQTLSLAKPSVLEPSQIPT